MHIAVLSGFVVSLAAPSLYGITRRSSGWVFSLLPFGLFLYFASFIPSVISGSTFSITYPWVPSLGVNLSFYLDGLSLLFALLVSGIGALVMIYAGGYLEGHAQLGRFFAFLSMFMASMLGVVLAGNLLLLFVFWELTSLSSYLLIGFEHEKEEARRAALRALLVTSGGGLALMVGFVLLGLAGGGLDMAALAGQGEALREHPLYLPILLLISTGAFAKSAQVPFHFWLPEAMQAPAPVSAYLHSATMVKAGVYLLWRLHQTLGGTEAWLYLVGGVGLATLVTGGYLALQQVDMKRILAYTTISSLGLMVMLIGLGSEEAVWAAVVYLLAHALYKGALFMTSGALAHETGVQEVDGLGGLRQKMPLLALITLLAALSLAGFGPLLSFIGKELLFEALLHMPSFTTLLIAGGVLFAAVSVTAALILTIRPFFGPPKPTPQTPHEPPLSLWLGPALLALAGLVLGLIPGLLAAPLVSQAAAGILGEPQAVDLAFWHGLTPALGLSGVSILLGLLLYRVWDPWRRAATQIAERISWGPARLYEASLAGLAWFSGRLTGLLQSGHLNHYVLITMAATVILVGFTLITRGEAVQALVWPELRFYEALLSILILLAAWWVVRTSSRLASVAALGILGYGVALIFLLFGAPDLAMTQFLVESVTVILMVLILYHLPEYSRLSSRATRARDAIFALLGGGLMTALVLIANASIHSPPISDYFLDNSLALAHGRNIVNAILVDFRAMDTLGEITVLSLAATGVYALLRLRTPGRKG